MSIDRKGDNSNISRELIVSRFV